MLTTLSHLSHFCNRADPLKEVPCIHVRHTTQSGTPPVHVRVIQNKTSHHSHQQHTVLGAQL